MSKKRYQISKKEIKAHSSVMLKVMEKRKNSEKSQRKLKTIGAARSGTGCHP